MNEWIANDERKRQTKKREFLKKERKMLNERKYNNDATEKKTCERKKSFHYKENKKQNKQKAFHYSIQRQLQGFEESEIIECTVWTLDRSLFFFELT